MKSLIAAALILALPLTSQAALKGAPYQPEVDARFSALEEDNVETAASARKQAKVVYDVAVDGGQSTAHDLGVTLPAGAVITGIFVYINTAFVKAGGGAGVASLALQCAGTRELMDYLNASAVLKDYAVGYSLAGDLRLEAMSAGSFIPVSSSDKFIQVASIPTACSVNAVVRGDSGYESYSAGKATFLIEYFNRD